MGGLGRLTLARRALGVCTLWCLVGAHALSGCGGEDPVQEVRRERLQPRDLRAERAKLQEKKRVANQDGTLIPSDQVVAGVVLPRGLRQVHALEHDWYFHTSASLEALRAYFGPRLFTGQIRMGGRGTVTFVDAKVKDSSEPHTVSVRIGPAPNSPRDNEVYISEQRFNPVDFPSEAEVRAKVEARRKYAD